MQRMRESTSAVVVSAVPMEKTSSGRSAGSKRSLSRDHSHGPPRAGAGVENLAARTNRTKHGSFDFERPLSGGTGAGGGMTFKSALRSMGIGEPDPPPAPAPAPVRTHASVSVSARQPLQRSSSARGVPVRRSPRDEPPAQRDGFAPSSLPTSRTPPGEKSRRPAGPPASASASRRPVVLEGFVTTAASRGNGTAHHSHSHSHAHSHSHSQQPHSHSHSQQSHSHHGHGQHHSRRDVVPASPISSVSGDSSGHTRDGSWGRSGASHGHGGKRAAHAHAHGLFKFEPAVPPIPGSPADSDRRPPRPPRSTARPTSPSPSPSPTPTPPPPTRARSRPSSPPVLHPAPFSSSSSDVSRSQQARLAGKGRSLDLGLGLTWAPSRVREDALLRLGPRGGVSASTSGVRSRWRSAGVRAGADEDGRLTAGVASDVAEAFREVLGDSAYAIFKNCQSLPSLLSVSLLLCVCAVWIDHSRLGFLASFFIFGRCAPVRRGGDPAGRAVRAARARRAAARRRARAGVQAEARSARTVPTRRAGLGDAARPVTRRDALALCSSFSVV